MQACDVDDIDGEDVVRFDHDGRTFAIYRSPEDTFHATDGLCTHERAHLADGLVMGDTIECPKHNGRFDYKTGEAKRGRRASISTPIRSRFRPARSSSGSADGGFKPGGTAGWDAWARREPASRRRASSRR